MIESILRMVAVVVCAVISWAVFIPLMFAVYTPVAMVFALWGVGRYGDNLRCEYRRLWKWWKDWGILIVPPW